MKIGGFQKLSLIDYPGKISSNVFTAGCNLRCPFCHVPQLVLPEKIGELESVPEEEVFAYLKKNKDLVDAVVITGGEPTIQPDIVDFIKKVKAMGFLVALETNGTNYEILETLVKKKLVDYVGLDVKTVVDFDSYNSLTGGVLKAELFENVKKSIELLKTSEIDYEFRTTLMKEYHDKDKVVSITESISGAKNYYLQNFKDSSETLSGKFTPFDEQDIESLVDEFKEKLNIMSR